MMAPSLQMLTQAFAEQLVNSATVGVMIAGLAWVLLRVAGRQNAGTRFAAWFSALLTIAFWPALSGWALFHPRLLSRATPAAHAHIILSSTWATYLFTAWIAGAILFLLRLAVGLWRIRGVRRNCAEVDLATLEPSIAEILHSFRWRRVTFCTSGELAVPAAVGLFRPAIVFPTSLLAQLSPNEIEVIVRHELAHLARWDDWTNLAQKLVKAVFFFHPAVWWIENRLTLEREMACDDIVLAQTASPRAYASSLISFAEKLHCARSLALAQALVSRMQQMSLRVAEILDAKRPSRTGLWKPILGLGAGLLALVLYADPYMPRFVAFQSPADSPRQVASTAIDSGITKTTARALAEPVVLRQSLASHPKAVRAAFHPHAVRSHAQYASKVSPTPLIMRTSASDDQPVAVQETVFILQGSPSEIGAPAIEQVWTLCIWTVQGSNSNVKHWQSTIVVSWI